MKFTDKLVPFKGNFLVKAQNVVTGKTWIHYEDLNTITLIAKRDTIRLLGGNPIGQDRVITKMKFGDGGHVSNPLDPNYGQAIPTYETQTNLVDPLITKNISSVVFYDNNTLNTSQGTFEVILDTTEGNGPSGTQIYSEAGLFTLVETYIDPVSGNMTSGLFAVKNFPIITKTAEIRLIFDWTIIL